MSEYTPSDGDILGSAGGWLEEYGMPDVNMNEPGNSPDELVDRWLAQHDTAVRADERRKPTAVTREELAEELRLILVDSCGPASDGLVTEGDDRPWPYGGDGIGVIHIDGSVELPQFADAILDEFTLTRNYEPAEVDPWVDPEPWVYVVTGKRAVHPLPQTYYRYAPRTHLDYNTEQDGEKL